MNIIRDAIEKFHLLFLDQFGRKIDKSCYALKGGCNLRFFFNSIRYSEDIDFDVQRMSVESLQNKVRSIFESSPFQHILQSHGFAIERWSEPKQTKTTQRWKVSLNVKFSSLPLNTKIEFSQRNTFDSISFELIHPNVIQYHQLQPIMVNHYTAQDALSQKIEALLNRRETQARDIFDIHLLINTAAKLNHLQLSNEKLKSLKVNLFNVSFNDFKSQVVAFLAQEYISQYDSAEVWDNLILNIHSSIEAYHHETD